jgi:Fe-S cluster assembly protein SufD
MSTSWEALKSQFETKHAQGFLQKQRENAFAAFEQIGLPERRNERWRATPLKRIFATQFKQQAPVSGMKPIEFPEAVYTIELKSGQVKIHQLPQGVVAVTMKDAWLYHRDMVERYFATVANDTEALTLLNTSLFDEGLMIWVPEGVHVDKPIVVHHQSDVDHLYHYRHLMVFEKHSSATVLEVFNSRETGSGFINHVCEMVIHEHARVEHYQAQMLNDGSYLQSELSVRQGADATFDAFLLQLGGQYSTCDMNIALEASHANCRLSGIYSPRQQQFHQQRLNVKHMVGECQSMQNFRGIADDKGHGVFMGQVYVHHDAQKTEAHQSNRNLILSKQAEITTLPQLQIFADDVICSHGATVGQLDEESLFYLQSRGFSSEEAKHVLVHAFLLEQFQYIPNIMIRKWCLEQFEQQRAQ